MPIYFPPTSSLHFSRMPPKPETVRSEKFVKELKEQLKANNAFENYVFNALALLRDNPDAGLSSTALTKFARKEGFLKIVLDHQALQAEPDLLDQYLNAGKDRKGTPQKMQAEAKQLLIPFRDQLIAQGKFEGHRLNPKPLLEANPQFKISWRAFKQAAVALGFKIILRKTQYKPVEKLPKEPKLPKPPKAKRPYVRKFPNMSRSEIVKAMWANPEIRKHILAGKNTPSAREGSLKGLKQNQVSSQEKNPSEKPPRVRSSSTTHLVNGRTGEDLPVADTTKADAFERALNVELFAALEALEETNPLAYRMVCKHFEVDASEEPLDLPEDQAQALLTEGLTFLQDLMTEPANP